MEEYHIDYAAAGSTNFGLSYFYGTSREPVLIFDPLFDQQGNLIPRLRPRYDLIHQIGLEAQYVIGPVIFKFEEMIRIGQGDQFITLTGGFEYTIANIFNTGKDIGLLGDIIMIIGIKFRWGPHPFHLIPFRTIYSAVSG